VTVPIYYVELNPVRAGITKRAWDYSWSSAAPHCGLGAQGTGLLDLPAWREQTAGMDWKTMLKAAAKEKEFQDTIGRNTHTGRPLGSDSFLSKVEYLVGRRVRPLPMGRQKGWRKGKGPLGQRDEGENNR